MSGTADSARGRVLGKTALISGGARGQGLSHGNLLAREGANVVLGDVLDEVGEAAAARLQADGLNVPYTHLDVTRPEDWDAAIALAETTFGKLDIVVNNAGISGPGTLLDCSIEEWNRILAVNLTGTFLGMKQAIPALRRAGGGSIINVSSVLGSRGSEAVIAYHASKAGVHILTRSAAVTLAPEIRVNCVVPGLVATELMLSTVAPDVLKQRLSGYPMGRAAKPEEISAGVLFLASDESSFITGADLPIDGGALAGTKRR